MKSSKELQSMLFSAICDSFDSIKEGRELDCYNELLGDTSILLSGILEKELENDAEWDSLKWFDDSLIHKVKWENRKVQLWGVMIWGKDGTTKQWTEPFYCEFFVDCENIKIQKLVFLFGDELVNEITYEKFALNRGFWDKNYYSDNQWTPSERNWKYIIHTKTLDNKSQN